jgi:hypothetical protein
LISSIFDNLVINISIFVYYRVEIALKVNELNFLSLALLSTSFLVFFEKSYRLVQEKSRLVNDAAIDSKFIDFFSEWPDHSSK